MTDNSGQRRITRQELHQMVWEQPIRVVAAILGIRPRGIQDLCDKLEVPYPKPHYWKRKAAGLPVVSFQLPEAPPGVQDYAVVQREAGSGSAKPPPMLSPTKGAVHPRIAEWLAKTEAIGRGQTPTDRRRLRILNIILKSWEAYGYSVEVEPSLLKFSLLFERVKIRCALRERMKQHQEVRFGYSSRVLKPSGQLLFQIEDYTPSELRLRREWSDTADRPLQDSIRDILQTLLATGPALAELQRQREAERRRYEEERAALWRQEEQRRLDDCRWSLLAGYASQAETIPRVERLLDDLESTASDLDLVVGDRSLRSWIEWARTRCRELDPRRLGAQVIFDGLAKANPHLRP